MDKCNRTLQIFFCIGFNMFSRYSFCTMGRIHWLWITRYILRWKGIEHIDVGGNCNFIHDGEDETEIKEAIIAIVNDSARYKEMLDCSLEKGKLFFSYFEIAKRALGN